MNSWKLWFNLLDVFGNPGAILTMRSLLRNPAEEIVSSLEGPVWKTMLRFLPEPRRDLSDKNSSLKMKKVNE